MRELKIPTVLAVGAWFASGLAVLSYTYIAYKETAHGQSGSGKADESGLVAENKVLATELLKQIKPLERGKFNTNNLLKAP